MNRAEMLEIFARHRGESPVIVGPGICGRILYKINHHPATIYNMELGYAGAMCLGLALSLPGERIFALEGDGSMLMAAGLFSTVARYRPKNLVVVVIDNRAYVTTGAMASATASGTDLAAMARGAGMDQVERVADAASLELSLKRATTIDGPHLIVVDVEPDEMADLGKYPAMPFDIVESAIRFRRNLEDRDLVPPIWAV
jgi:sulfopyruvate decarboxylase subunit beta